MECALKPMSKERYNTSKSQRVKNNLNGLSTRNNTHTDHIHINLLQKLEIGNNLLQLLLHVSVHGDNQQPDSEPSQTTITLTDFTDRLKAPIGGDSITSPRGEGQLLARLK